MPEIGVSLRNIAGTEAAMGWAGSHTVIADRPAGVATGLGLGFNGAQLLALAIGGCFCNDLRYVAHELGAAIDTVSVDVTLDLEGKPPIATKARMHVICVMQDGSDPAALIAKAKSSCMASNSLPRGIQVAISS
jgi:organic hydroperoxide reductase OsmC/OhrA